MKEAEAAFADDDYDRAEHLARLVAAMVRREAPIFVANPTKWIEKWDEGAEGRYASKRRGYFTRDCSPAGSRPPMVVVVAVSLMLLLIWPLSAHMGSRAYVWSAFARPCFR